MIAMHVTKRIIVVADGKALGSVSVTGTTRIAEMDAMHRAARLAADKLGYDWAVAWQTYGKQSGTIAVSVSDRPNAGRTVARWAFYEVR